MGVNFLKNAIVMNRLLLFLLMSFMVFQACSRRSGEGTSHSLPVIMNMVFNNPGEAATVTKYNDPAYLKSLGYTAMVPEWHIQCAITYDSFKKGIIPEGSVDRSWIVARQRWIKEQLDKTEQAGIDAYAFMDVLVLPVRTLERYKDSLVRNPAEQTGGDVIHGRMAPSIERPLTRKLLRIQLDEIFSCFPQLDGLVIRFGETYLFDTPYHAGGSPVSGTPAERIRQHVKLVNILREEVCVKRNKKLFYRTWDFGFFHTRPDIYLKITDQVEPHRNLYFSIKYPKGDFQRLLPFNPTLGIGGHQYVVEYQCQPEYYGKGAHPDYLFNGFLNGFEEYSQLMNPGDKWGVRDLTDDPHFRGIWTWSRGGGWRGPYITHELWCDLNAFTALIWACDTTLTEDRVLDSAALKLGVREESLDDFRELVHLSAKGVVRGHASLIDIPKARFNVWWIRDQYMSDMSSLNPFFDYLMHENKEEEAIREKDEAVAIWKKMEYLAGNIRMKDPGDEEYLKVSVTYGRIKYEIIRNAFTAILLGYKGDKTGHYEKKRIRQAIARYDTLWEEWRKLKNDYPSCATLYEPNAFRIGKEGVTGDKAHGLAARLDKYRAL